MPNKIMPVLFSLPVIAKLELPKRSEILPKIESGELEHIDFEAYVYNNSKKIRNPYMFKAEDLRRLANSYEGKPFLRNHDTYDIDARDGTILASALEGAAFKQTIRLTTRRGMTDFVEGKIDRFSIGWNYDDIQCSICKQSYFSYECRHSPGRIYKVDGKDVQALLVFINPDGKETSAVNNPAVDGTEIISRLEEHKLEVIGEVTAVTHARRASNPKLVKGVMHMKKKVTQDPALALEDGDELSENERAAFELQGVNETIAELQEKQKQANDLHIAQCQSLLDTSLSASKLPAAAQKAVRKPFEKMLADGRPFLATELQTAITEKREELAEIGAGSVVQGPGRASGFFNGADQFRLAVEDLFGVERDPSEKNIKAAKLRGIQEAYLMATGDQSFVGGYFPEFSLVTANFPGIIANVQNKMLIKAWADLEDVYGWWKDIVTVEHFTNFNQVTWVRTGTIASLPTVAERGEYQELPIGDAKETSDWTKYGGYVPLTIEAVWRDDLQAFKRMPREVAFGGIRNISEQVAYIFTQNSGAGPTMSDGGALFNATAQTTAGGHLNLLTTALGTDYTAWNAVATAMFKKKMLVKNATGYYGTGKPFGMKPNICLVPADLITQAEALFLPRWQSEVPSIASSGGPSFGGKVKPIAVPEWTDATDWAAVNNRVPGIMIGELFGLLPQIISAAKESDPAMFANDESRLKVRQILTVGVADDLPLAKNNVA